MQVRTDAPVELASIAERWHRLGAMEKSPFFVRCRLTDPADTTLTLFADGRLIIHGTQDVARAKSLYARFVGC